MGLSLKILFSQRLFLFGGVSDRIMPRIINAFDRGGRISVDKDNTAC